MLLLMNEIKHKVRPVVFTCHVSHFQVVLYEPKEHGPTIYNTFCNRAHCMQSKSNCKVLQSINPSIVWKIMFALPCHIACYNTITRGQHCLWLSRPVLYQSNQTRTRTTRRPARRNVFSYQSRSLGLHVYVELCRGSHWNGIRKIASNWI